MIDAFDSPTGRTYRLPFRSRLALPRIAALDLVSCAAFLTYFILALPLMQRQLWIDEFTSLLFASSPTGFLLWSIRTWEAHPPLFYVLLKAFHVFFQSDQQMRALPLLFGAGSLLITGQIAHYYSGKRGRALALGLCCGMYPLLWGSTELRNYSLHNLICLSSWYLLLKAKQSSGSRKDRLYWTALAVSFACGWYTFYYSMLFCVAFGLVFLIQARDRQELARFAYACAVAVLLFLPWIPTFLSQRGRVTPNVNASFSGIQSLQDVLVRFTIYLTPSSPLAGIQYLMDSLTAWDVGRSVGIGLLCLLCLPVAFAPSKLRTSAAFVLLLPLFYAALVLLTPYFGAYQSPKYTTLLAPMIVISIAYFAPRLRWQWCALIALVIVPANLYQTARAPIWAVADWRSMYPAVHQSIGLDVPLILAPGYIYGAVAYYDPARFPAVYELNRRMWNDFSEHLDRNAVSVLERANDKIAVAEQQLKRAGEQEDGREDALWLDRHLLSHGFIRTDRRQTQHLQLTIYERPHDTLASR